MIFMTRHLSLLAALAVCARAFVPQTSFSARMNDLSLSALSPPGEDGSSFFESLANNAKTRFNIARRSASEGSGFKQLTADVLAGEYDAAAVKSKVEALAKSAPCVMFTWEASPSCKQALRAMEMVGADVKVVRMDDPWDEGNPMRAELGKMTGKTSVPSVWIDGKYVGGYDRGVSDDAPGLVDLAFRGTLRPMLEAAGALKGQGQAATKMAAKDESVVVDIEKPATSDVVAESDTPAAAGEDEAKNKGPDDTTVTE